MAQKDKAVVKASLGFTLNLGNYESARIEAGVEIQGDKDNLAELWKQAENEVSTQLETQIALLREQLGNKNTTLLGKAKAPNITSKLT